MTHVIFKKDNQQQQNTQHLKAIYFTLYLI